MADSSAPKPLGGGNVKIKRRRGYVFTCNNYTPEDEERIQTIIKGECSYGVYGREIAPSTSTQHLQGCVEFTHPRTFTGAIAALSGCHVEERKGTPREASDYCKKTRDVWEYGTVPKGSGARSDLDQVRHSVQQGESLRSYASDVGPQALRYAEQLLKYTEKERDFKPVVIWFYGPTGAGKTMTARQLSTDPWTSHEDLEWWDGYDAHKHVIFDDFRASHCKYSVLLRVLDRYPFRVAVKGGFRQLLAEQMIITSCHSPWDVYSKKVTEDVAQLIRRIDLIVQFHADGTTTMIKDLPAEEEPPADH